MQPAMRPVVDRVLDDEEDGDLTDDGRPRGKRDVIGSQTEITHKRVEAGDLQVGSRSVTVGGGGLSDGLDGLKPAKTHERKLWEAGARSALMPAFGRCRPGLTSIVKWHQSMCFATRHCSAGVATLPCER